LDLGSGNLSIYGDYPDFFSMALIRNDRFFLFLTYRFFFWLCHFNEGVNLFAKMKFLINELNGSRYAVYRVYKSKLIKEFPSPTISILIIIFNNNQPMLFLTA